MEVCKARLTDFTAGGKLRGGHAVDAGAASRAGDPGAASYQAAVRLPSSTLRAKGPLDEPTPCNRLIVLTLALGSLQMPLEEAGDGEASAWQHISRVKTA